MEIHSSVSILLRATDKRPYHASSIRHMLAA